METYPQMKEGELAEPSGYNLFFFQALIFK